MNTEKQLPSPDPNNFRNHLFEGTLTAPKTHPESRKFKYRSNGRRFHTRLDFKEETDNREFGPFEPSWDVVEGNLHKHSSLSSRILIKPYGRIIGIEYGGYPRSYRYDESTRNQAFWHENKPYYDRQGFEHDPHASLDWPETLTRHQFAERVAARWNIETWVNQPSLELLGEEETDE